MNKTVIAVLLGLSFNTTLYANETTLEAYQRSKAIVDAHLEKIQRDRMEQEQKRQTYELKQQTRELQKQTRELKNPRR